MNNETKSTEELNLVINDWRCWQFLLKQTGSRANCYKVMKVALYSPFISNQCEITVLLHLYFIRSLILINEKLPSTDDGQKLNFNNLTKICNAQKTMFFLHLNHFQNIFPGPKYVKIRLEQSSLENRCSFFLVCSNMY